MKKIPTTILFASTIVTGLMTVVLGGWLLIILMKTDEPATLESLQQQISNAEAAILEDYEVAKLVPETKIKKAIAVANTGTEAVFVRVSFEEVFCYLASKGEAAAAATPYESAESEKTDLPVPLDAAAYQAEDSGYRDVSKQVSPQLPEGVQVWMKGRTVEDEASGELIPEIDYSAFYAYQDEEGQQQYQLVDLDLTIEAYIEAGQTESDWTFTYETCSYLIYPGGYAYSVVNWAVSSEVNCEGLDTGCYYLGTSGEKHGSPYDYSVAVIGSLPATAAFAQVEAPVEGSEVLGVLADRQTSSGMEGLFIEYGAAISTSQEIVAATWMYNQDDGYFYYTSKLEPEEETPNLTENLVLTDKVNHQYYHARYDLMPKVEAVTGTSTALTDETGWFLSEEQGDATSALLAFLIQ